MSNNGLGNSKSLLVVWLEGTTTTIVLHRCVISQSSVGISPNKGAFLGQPSGNKSDVGLCKPSVLRIASFAASTARRHHCKSLLQLSPASPCSANCKPNAGRLKDKLNFSMCQNMQLGATPNMNPSWSQLVVLCHCKNVADCTPCT